MNYQRVQTEDLAAPAHSTHQPEADEISLADLLRVLWHGRTLIVLFPLVAMAIAALAMITTALRIDNPTIYYVKLNGIDNGQYPNGTAFSPQDLTIPAVLSKLRDRYDIPDSVDLADVIDVTYGNPLTKGLTRAYRERLSNRDLSAADLERINETYQRRLEAAVQSTLRIEVDNDLIGADASTGALIAHALPDIWSTHFSEYVHIFQDTQLADISVPGNGETLQTPASILAAKQSLTTMASGLDILASDNRLSLVKSDDGHSVEDLKQELKRFSTIYFNSLAALGAQSDTGVGAAYVKDLKLRLGELRQHMKSYDDSLQDLQRLRSPAETSESGDGSRPFGPGSVQLAETGLSEIMQLAQRASLSDYMEELLRSRQQIAFQIAGVEREIEMVTRDGDTEPPAAFRQQAARTFEDLTNQYTDLLERARTRLRAQVGSLYTPVTSPMSLGSFLPKRTVLAVVLAGGLGALLGVVFVLLRASFRNGKANP